MNANNVLDALKDYLGLTTDAELASAFGVSPQNLSGWRRRDSININKIVKSHPELNEAWLLTGEGEMLKGDKSEEYRLKSAADISPFLIKPNELELTPENSIVYHPDLRVTGGNIDNLSGDELNTVLLYISGYHGCHAFPAVGHSMYPTIASGDIVICKEYTDHFIPNGDIFIVITHDQLLVKRITLHQEDNPEDNYFILSSDNPNKDMYAPFKLMADDVKSLYKVLAVLKRF